MSTSSRHGRKWPLAALSLALAGLLALSACSSSGSGDSDAADSARNVSVTHALGTSEFTATPKRVIATGPSVETVLALGIKPVAVVVLPQATEAPWLTGKLDGVERIEGAGYGDMPLEKIAALSPDLIVGDKWQITADNYPKLSEIAPTVGAIGTDDEGNTWQKQIVELGKVLDKEKEAAKVLSDDDALFAKVREELPGLKGKTGVIAQHIAQQNGIGVIADPKDTGNALLYDLGMKVPDAWTGKLRVDAGRALVSAENTDLLAADFMVAFSVGGDDAALRAVPGFTSLPQVKSGATVFGTKELVHGINLPGPLSRPWILEQIRPALEKAAKA